MSEIFEQYVKIIIFIFQLCGNEFVTQLLLVSLLFIPLKKRSFFYIRYPLSLGIIIGLQWLFPIKAPWHYIEIATLLFLLVLFCYDCNLSQGLFVSLCMYSVQFILSALSYSVVYFVMFVTNNPMNFYWYYVIMPIMMIGIFILAYFFLVKNIVKKEKLVFTNYTLFYAVGAFIAVTVFLSHYGSIAVFYSLQAQICLRMTSALLVFSTLIIGFMNIKNKNLEFENKILSQLLYKDKQRYEQAKISNEKISIKYHDLKKREREGIIHYEEMKEINLDKEILTSTYFTENKALDVILSEKALMCEKHNIRFVCTADGKALDHMKSYHIYSLLGNALDNAIESTKKLEQDDIKEIDINIFTRGKMSVVNITNHFSGNGADMEDGMPVTTKEDKEEHGYGTKSMKSIVELYGGSISFNQNNGIFTVIAMIPKTN